MSANTEEPVEDEAEASIAEVVLVSSRLLLTILNNAQRNNAQKDINECVSLQKIKQLNKVACTDNETSSKSGNISQLHYSHIMENSSLGLWHNQNYCNCCVSKEL